ncbi:hypothetical protein ACFSJU_03810 [Paradesertivirga mongoliensis]|uniref:DUF922 domain-containing protein n=1 Tax=Paradesertivirga mongoliensis TaxID=2100740 RepID=A0ABW4ZHI6_9SPHI|nr:hypothetical protein [Pedobacter mongoliensis]
MKIATVLFILISNASFSQAILWKENFKLDWKNFKGPTEDQDVAAVTHCGIRVKPTVKVLVKGKATYTAFAEFTCDSSFYFPQKVDSLVLAHEQLHFDIAELFARKLRQRFTDRGFITPVEARNLFNKLHKEYFDFQSRIEEETSHGTKLEEEKKWEQFVSNAIRELNKYK